MWNDVARSDLSSNHEREGSGVSLGGRWRALVFTGTEWGSFATHHRRNEHDALTTVDSRRATTTDVLRSEAAADVKHNGGAARGSARRRSSIAAVRERAASVANVGAKMATSVAQVGCLAQRLKGNKFALGSGVGNHARKTKESVAQVGRLFWCGTRTGNMLHRDRASETTINED